LRPTLIRGDIAHDNEKMMAGSEERQLPHLFKFRLQGWRRERRVMQFSISVA
jgi:hypothetical protein